ncbi:MAG: hypothetical protein ABL307_08935 [Roseitalea porphyridii]|uniref:Uncharacterized protein n=1 Tax=Roseitalea porphyridii TaxID=1852022 RepID=A0A4P6V208_9HYPH|nr:hypothetical protein [Roseitalea porphyridii]QBK31477.1 hypothetical protein E0E05_13185 [Roseitalea porphyridii]
MANTNRKGFFRHALDAMIEARSRQVAGYVNGTLLMLDDDELRERGYDRDTLKRRPHFTPPF